MDVVNDPDCRSVSCDQLEQLSSSPERLRKAELLATQSDDGGDAIDDRAIADKAVQLRHALLRRIVRLNPSSRTGGFDERPERDAFAVWQAASAENQGSRIARVDELADQAALPGAGIRNHGRHATGPLIPRALEDFAERRHLTFAPDHRSVLAPPEAFNRARYRQKPVRGAVFGLALELKRLHRLDGHRIAHQAMSQLADEDDFGRCGLFKSRCDVHGVAGDEALAEARITRDHFAGVDPNLVFYR